MKKFCLLTLSLAFLVGFALPATAQTVDGTLVGDETFYGSALSIQNTATGFGDAVTGDPQFGGSGSEIDQVFGRVDNNTGRLHVLVTGNLEGVQGGTGQFNKLEVFLDSVPGGVNTIDGLALPVAVDAFCCGGFGTFDGALQRMNGLTFDSGFEADYFMTFSNGFESVGDPSTTFWAMNSHYADLTQGDQGLVSSNGIRINPFGAEPGLPTAGTIIDQDNNGWDGPDDPNGTPPEHEFVEPVSPNDPTNLRNHRDMLNQVDMQMSIDNSNIIGVEGGADPFWDTLGDPQEVVTGIEFSIPLSQIGNPSGDIRLTAFINGNGHHYASNQFSGEGIVQGNLGGDGVGGFTGDLLGVDLSTIAGDQFVTIANSTSLPDVDFNDDGLVDCMDVDALTAAIANGGPVPDFDLNGDGSLDADDLDVWLTDGATANGLASPYKPGDANVDGVVEVADFNVWNSNKFTSTTAWCSGDFNLDTVVDVGDFNQWNNNKFTSSDAAAVPEPASLALVFGGLISLLGLRRRS